MEQHAQTQKKTLIGYVMAALFAIGAAVAGYDAALAGTAVRTDSSIFADCFHLLEKSSV